MDELARLLTAIRTQSGTDSPARWLASHSAPRLALLTHLSDAELAQLEYCWPFWARAEQLPPPGHWRFWLFRGGRGGGKTRAGAEAIRAGVEAGQYRHVALVAPTIASGRQVMIEGESGLLAVCPPWCRPRYEPSRQRLYWPNGAIATLFSADTPERLRGPQHDAFWADELCAWREPLYAWDMLLLGLRLGRGPRGIITTTPKPVTLYKQLLEDPTVVVTVSSTLRNAANLAPEFLSEIITRYQGTRLGRQELDAELVDDVEGALWQRAWLHQSRVSHAPTLEEIIVAIDPAVSGSGTAHEAGIVVAGIDRRDHVYVLADRSMRGSPDRWARRAIDAYHEFGASQLVAEGNQGGELVRLTLQTVDPTVDITIVHASAGKKTRAEPVAALYEQGRVHHVGTFPTLEDQLCLWDATSSEISPDRLDALVWAVTQLGVDNVPVALMPSATDRLGAGNGRSTEDDHAWLQDLLLNGMGPKRQRP